MNTLQGQIGELRDKVDGLYSLIEQMSAQIAALDNRQSKSGEQESYSLPNFASGVKFLDPEEKAEYQLTHKDILIDDNSSTNSASANNENLSPDTQIRRLTAQLTAAYNRIAALEEQLLTYRIRS